MDDYVDFIVKSRKLESIQMKRGRRKKKE